MHRGPIVSNAAMRWSALPRDNDRCRESSGAIACVSGSATVGGHRGSVSLADEVLRVR
jgi:hypothetical protein